MEGVEEENFYPNTDLSVWLRSCQKEVEKPLLGKLALGEIPKWLNGCLVRNGPGGIDIYSQGSCKHLFDGPGLLQKFEISNGTIYYTNRFIRTKSFVRNMAAIRLVLSEFGTFATPDPCQTIFERIRAVFLGPLDLTLTDTANISIQPFGDEIYSLAETPFAHRIDLKNLETIKTVDVNQEIGVVNHTSHPHVSKDNVYNIGQKLSVWLGPHYVIVELDTKSKKTQHADRSQEKQNDFGDSKIRSPWSRAKILASIPSRWPLSLCYMHSFSLTPNFFILIEQPLSIFLPSIPLNQICGDKPISSCLRFFPEEDTLFHVISRNHNHLGSQFTAKTRRTFRVPSLFFLHTINAFEIDDQNATIVVVDICCYNDPSMIDCMYVEALKNAHSNPNYANMFRGRPKRFYLKLSDFDNSDSGIMPPAESEVIVDIGCETPRINYDLYNGKPYRYFYAISSDVDMDNPGTLIKVDTELNSYKTWCEANAYPSEPIFVQNPDLKGEDSGIILSSVVYGKEKISGPNRTSIIILDAQTWQILTKVNFQSESAIPKCLHGWYFPSSDSSSEKENSLHSKETNMNLSSSDS